MQKNSSKKNNNIKALKSGIWYTASNFLVKSIGFLTTPIFTRLLTRSEFGIYNNYISWLSIITIFVTLNLESTLISARYDYEEDFDRYILSMLALSCCSVAIWFVIINTFSYQFESFLDLDKVYINAMLLYLLFLPAVNMFQARERYYFEYKKTVITSLILSIGTAMLSVILVVMMPDRLTGRVLGMVIPTIILGALFYMFFLVKGKYIKISYWKYAIVICLPYIPHLLSLNLLNSTDKVMINKWCGAEATALYSLAYTCGTMVTLLMTSLNGAFAPWLGEKLSENKTGEIRNFSKIYISVFFYLAIGIMLISPEILFILGGKNYLEAVYVLAPVSMGCVCQFMYTMLVNIEQFKKKTMGMAMASMAAAMINLGLNYLFIPKYGYIAAAYTTLIGYICLLLMHMFLVYRLKLNNVYDYKFIGMVTILGLVVTIIINILYSYNLIRIMLCFVYAIVLCFMIYKHKDKILMFLKKRK